MNKNSRYRAKIAHKNAKNGQTSTSFDIPQTMSGRSMGARKQKIDISGNTENKDRNMRQVVRSNPGDSRTFHEPIDKSRPFMKDGKVNNRKLEGVGGERRWENK